MLLRVHRVTSVKVASILIYLMLKQLVHFLQNILEDYCTNHTRINNDINTEILVLRNKSFFLFWKTNRINCFKKPVIQRKQANKFHWLKVPLHKNWRNSITVLSTKDIFGKKHIFSLAEQLSLLPCAIDLRARWRNIGNKIFNLSMGSWEDLFLSVDWS